MEIWRHRHMSSFTRLHTHRTAHSLMWHVWREKKKYTVKMLHPSQSTYTYATKCYSTRTICISIRVVYLSKLKRLVWLMHSNFYPVDQSVLPPGDAAFVPSFATFFQGTAIFLFAWSLHFQFHLFNCFWRVLQEFMCGFLMFNID